MLYIEMLLLLNANIIIAWAQVSTSWQVVSAGGLHVVGTERHEARRIDNQVIVIFFTSLWNSFLVIFWHVIVFGKFGHN